MFIEALTKDETLTPTQRERMLLSVKARGLALAARDWEVDS
jgi:hypothetical protein